MKMNFFATISDAVNYMANGPLAEMREDLRRMEQEERRCYSDKTREMMRARIADLESVAPLVVAAFAKKSSSGDLAGKAESPCAPREGETGFVVEYELPYTHRVQVGVFATSAEEASAKAEEAFNLGTLWDNTLEMPLLFDDYEEDGNAGVALEFRVIAKGAFPEPDGSVRGMVRAAKASAVLTALEKGEITEAIRLARG